MARLVGFIGNRPDLCNRFAAYEEHVLCTSQSVASEPPASGAATERPEGEDGAWGWGVGFYQSGEVLLKRRPLDERTELTTAQMIAEVRSDVLIAHVRRATIGAFRTDNTHPFRYRQWMFADKGTVGGFGVLRPKLHESLPRFLQRSVRGETDSELLFHLFLSFLHDAGHLDRPVVPPEDAYPALRATLGLVDRIAKQEGVDAARVNILVATPEYLMAMHRGRKMAYRALAGREDFEPLYEQQGPSKLRMPDLEPCRLCVVASDFDDDTVPEGWTEVPHGAIVSFTRTDAPAMLYQP